jgi:hypothetical protein
MGVNVTIVVPRVDRDAVSDGLRKITEAIHRAKKADGLGGGLGGMFGYGADYENEVFMIHRFCWCDEDSCKWCGETQAPHFVHKPSDSTVHWYKYIGRGMAVNLSTDWSVIEDECMRSINE